jgi:nicotinamidase-related amidase
MRKKSPDLHGNAPDNSEVALLLIDVINDLEFEGAERLGEHVLPAAQNIKALKQRAKAAGIPAIYVNDNFGKWRSDFKKLVAHVIEDGTRGQEMAELLRPEDDDYFVLKPKQSGFYSTSLDILLKHLGTETLILTGVAGDICVLLTASDAHIRDYQLVVPSDCVASQDAGENQRVLKYMRRVLEANIQPASELNFQKLKRSGSETAPSD